MKKFEKIKIFLGEKIIEGRFLFLSLFVFFLSFNLAGAEDYKALAPIPGIEFKSGDFGGYIASIFKLSISVAAVLAILQLSAAGVEYMTMESFTGKSDAKKRMKNAFWGLLLILGSYLLLQTINPDLVNNEFKIPSTSGK